MAITIAQLEKLKKAGKIRGYHMTATRPGRKRLLKKKGKQHYWIEINLQAWSEANGFELSREFRFHIKRKHRFDWFVKKGELKIGIEYEGIFSEKSRHTTFKGYSGDAEKYNLAAANGFIVLRYTALTYKSMFDDLNKLI